MKYKVTLEFKVKSIDLLDIEVEAVSREDAIRKAQDKYLENHNDVDMRSSDTYESKLDIWNMDIDVEELE